MLASFSIILRDWLETLEYHHPDVELFESGIYKFKRLKMERPNISDIRMISRGATKGRSRNMSHDFEFQKEVEVLIFRCGLTLNILLNFS